jgi:exodeoxyribonuclease VII small subunit
MAPRKKDEPSTPRSFEEAMQRLESVVAKLEEDKVPLDEMLANYEEGVSLARYCSEKLETAEQKVRLITREANGGVKLDNFDESEES